MKLELIKEYRKKNQLKQNELAQKLNVSQQMLSYYENGMNPSLEFVREFKKLTGIDLLDGTLNTTENKSEIEVIELRKENEMLKQLLIEKDKRIDFYESIIKKMK